MIPPVFLNLCVGIGAGHDRESREDHQNQVGPQVVDRRRSVEPRSPGGAAGGVSAPWLSKVSAAVVPPHRAFSVETFPVTVVASV